MGCVESGRCADLASDPCCDSQAGRRGCGPPKGRDDRNYVAAPRLGDSCEAVRRFERVTFAFGGQRSFFEPNMGRSFRKPAILIAQMLASRSSLAGFLALSPPKLRWRLFYPRRGQSGTLLCTGLVKRGGTSAVLHELIRYCNAVPEKVRRHRGTNR